MYAIRSYYVSYNNSVSYLQNFPSLQGNPSPARLLRMARALQDFDLVLTYNWGAVDVTMAHTLFSDMLGLPPLIHHEEWSGEDEAMRNNFV